MSDRIKLDDVVPGKTTLRVETTAGFSCLEPNTYHTVYLSQNGLLYITCRYGRHYLIDEVDKQNYLVGFKVLQ